MPWFTSENIDMAELATTYRTPDQGVSAKSNSNIVFNDYRKMPPQANGSNNTLTTQGSQTLRFDDLADTGGVVGASNSVTSTSTKFSSTTTYNGVFTSSAMLLITGFNRNVAQGHFGLGAQQAATGGTGITVRNGNFQVGSFPSVSNGTTQIIGMGTKSAALGGGTMYFIVSNVGYQQSAPPDNCWTTLRIRTLQPNGGSTFVINGVTYTTYNTTATYNRSDGWTSTVTGSTRVFQATYPALGQTGTTYTTSAGYVLATPVTIEII